MLTILRASLRMTRLVTHLIMGTLKSIYLRQRHGTNWHEQARGQAVIQQWMRTLSRILGLRITVPQAALPVPAMIVANHISWLDIIAIASVRPALFLAKTEVRQWPLIGTLMARCGTRFIQRNRSRAVRESGQQLCQALRLRQHVAIFPEGTTRDGKTVGRFYPALFEAARQAYCPIQPLAIRYGRLGQPDTRAPYIDDDTFIVHLWRILARRETHVELRFLPPISSREPRRQLAEHSRDLIVTALENQNDIPLSIPVLEPLQHSLPLALRQSFSPSLPNRLLEPPLRRESACAQKGA